MARESVKHPYTSSASAITQMIGQLRRAFPSQLSSETLKKLAIAPNNESHVLNVLRFLQIVDNDGNKIAEAAKVFTRHADADFQQGFAGLVSEAYSDLFAHYGDDTWSLNTDKLISFFRGSDHTSDIVGRRQTTTFQTLALLAGKLDAVPTSRSSGTKTERPTPSKPAQRTKAAAAGKKATQSQPAATAPAVVESRSESANGNGDMALTVRIEINLPAGGDQETYDNIFKSIRENLLNAKPA